MQHVAAAALVAAMMRDKSLADCANASGKTPQAYFSQAFDYRDVTLRTGERMIVAIASDESDGCVARGGESRVEIFERIAGGYRRVLDSVAIPEHVEVGGDGTATLPEHELENTIVEKAFFWNGSAYEFSAVRSHVYDVALGERRPYQVPVRFAPGTFETTFSGTAAYNFGQDYVFEARAGQRLTMELTKHTIRLPKIYVAYGTDVLSTPNAGRWSVVLPHTGTYVLTIEGGDLPEATPISSYVVRLSIR
jgi:hypothetical protein